MNTKTFLSSRNYKKRDINVPTVSDSVHTENYYKVISQRCILYCDTSFGTGVDADYSRLKLWTTMEDEDRRLWTISLYVKTGEDFEQRFENAEKKLLSLVYKDAVSQINSKMGDVPPDVWKTFTTLAQIKS